MKLKHTIAAASGTTIAAGTEITATNQGDKVLVSDGKTKLLLSAKDAKAAGLTAANEGERAPVVNATEWEEAFEALIGKPFHVASAEAHEMGPGKYLVEVTLLLYSLKGKAQEVAEHIADLPRLSGKTLYVARKWEGEVSTTGHVSFTAQGLQIHFQVQL